MSRWRLAFVTVCCFVSCGLALVSSAQGQTSALEPAALAAKADSLWRPFASLHSPGCGVGVLQSGRVIFRRDYGMADVPAAKPITPMSVFPVQSMQKMFLAYAILRLEQQGRLRLDDPVRKFVPRLAALDSAITLRRLMQHTSGLPDVGNLVQFMGWPDDEYRPRSDWMAIIANTRALNFTPGTRDSYSNSVQVILPAVIEAITGQPVNRALQQLVFQPLNMMRTSYRVSPGDRAATLVTPHRAEGANIAIPTKVTAPAVQTTRDDLLTWAAYWLNAQASRDSSLIRQMKSRTLLPSGQLTEYGLGLQYIRYRGVDAWYHGGDSPQEGHSILIMWPEFDAAVAVLCNSGGIPVLGRAVQLSEFVFAPLWNDATSRTASRSSGTPSLATFTGLYFGYDGGPSLRRVRVRGDTLGFVDEDGEVHPLQQLGAQTFAVPNSQVNWIFRGDTLWRRESLATARFVRVGEPGAVDVERLAGCYRDPVYGALARIAREGNRLKLRWGADTTAHELRAQFADGYTDGFSWLWLSRDTSGQVRRVSLHQERVWRLDLTRVGKC